MNQRSSRCFLGFILLGLCLNGCGSVTLQSQWLKGPISVDGKDGEWRAVEGADEGDISFKAMNDDKFLYLCLATSSREIKSQVAGAFKQNLNLWFDPQHKNQESGGLGLALYPDHSAGYPRLPEAESDYLGSASRVLSIVMPGKPGYPRALAADSKEAELAMALEHGRLVMEIKVPLTADAAGNTGAYAIGAQPGQLISLAFSSSPIDAGAASDEMALEHAARDTESKGGGQRRGGGMEGGGGMGGGGGRHHHGGGGGGGQGGGSPGQSASAPDHFELWANLRLAQSK